MLCVSPDEIPSFSCYLFKKPLIILPTEAAVKSLHMKKHSQKNFFKTLFEYLNGAFVHILFAKLTRKPLAPATQSNSSFMQCLF